MQRIIFPIIYAGEWLFLFYVFILVSIFHMTFYANIILIDMPWEEKAILPFTISMLIIFGIGLLCSLYIKYLAGSKLYKIVKVLIWGVLVGCNFLSCMMWMILGFSFGFSYTEQILIFMNMIVSAFLTLQVIKKLRCELLLH